MSDFDYSRYRFACIVGAPRTGTTSLARFVRSHDSVCFSLVKEPHFFSRLDLTDWSDSALRELVAGEYLERFFPQRRDSGCSLLMEASVTYLYVAEQMQPIVRLWPGAKFIIALRDPLEMLPSLHQRLLYLGDETVEDFETAWRLSSRRKAGLDIPRSCVEPRWLRYDEAGRLGHYVERFIAAVGRDRCHFILHDDLRARPRSVFRELEQLLEVPPSDSLDTEPKRARRGYRYGWLQRLLMRPPVARETLAGIYFRRRVDSLARVRGLDHASPGAIERFRQQLLRWNEAEAPPPRLSRELRQELHAFYAADVAHLSRLIGRDLSHWLRVEPIAASRAIDRQPSGHSPIIEL